MTAVIEVQAHELTAVDLVDKFGPIPLRRIPLAPRPGSATERDAVMLLDRDGCLCELIDGILVEKVLGQYESRVAAELIYILKTFLRGKSLGKVFGSDGMMKLAPGLIRMPDVSFVSSERLKHNTPTPWRSLVPLVPNLAAEVLSPGNTKPELERKLVDYFDAGVQLVWYLDPRQQTVTVYTGVDQERTIRSPEPSMGDPVLPGLSISLDELFAPADA